MTVPMMKFNGKIVPAKKVDGKWMPMENSELVINKDDKLEVREKKEEKK